MAGACKQGADRILLAGLEWRKRQGESEALLLETSFASILATQNNMVFFSKDYFYP